MSIPPMTERGAIDRLQLLVDDLREQVEYHEKMEEKENCYMCHVKSVQFPAKVEKVREQVREKVVNDIIRLLDDLAMPGAVIAIRKHYGEMVPHEKG